MVNFLLWKIEYDWLLWFSLYLVQYFFNFSVSVTCLLSVLSKTLSPLERPVPQMWKDIAASYERSNTTRQLQCLSTSGTVSWKWILACGDQPALLLHSSRSSSHWMQRTLEEKLMLNGPRMESSKIWMRCSVSTLCSFLHRECKPDVRPGLPTSRT